MGDRFRRLERAFRERGFSRRKSVAACALVREWLAQESKHVRVAATANTQTVLHVLANMRAEMKDSYDGRPNDDN